MTADELAAPAQQPASTRRDGILLGAGTFTAFRVPAPRRVDAAAGAVSVLTAPIWGLVVGLVGAAAGLVITKVAEWSGNSSPLTALLAGVGAAAACAWATRGLHLDGLADFADALASARRGQPGLDVMRDPRIGALGAVSLGLALLMQGLSLGTLFASGQGAACVVAVAMLARAPLGVLARRGTPADHSGLGRTVVGSTSTGRATATGVAATAAAVAFLVLAGGVPVGVALATGVACWLGALWVRRAALGRFQALTGDALGAAVEVGGTAALVILAIAG